MLIKKKSEKEAIALEKDFFTSHRSNKVAILLCAYIVHDAWRQGSLIFRKCGFFHSLRKSALTGTTDTIVHTLITTLFKTCENLLNK